MPTDKLAIASQLREAAEEMLRDARALQDAASILDGLPGGAPLPAPEATPPPQPAQLTPDQEAELKRLRDQKDGYVKRISGLESRVKRQEDHIAAVEARLREVNGSDAERIAKLQLKCEELRKKLADAESAKMGAEEDLKAVRGQIQDLEELLENATMPEGAGDVNINDLMPAGEPLAKVKLRDGGPKSGPPQYVFSVPKTHERLKAWSERMVGQEFGFYLRGNSLVLRPTAEPFAPPSPPEGEEENRKARESAQTFPVPPPLPKVEAEKPSRKPPAGAKTTLVTEEIVRDAIMTLPLDTKVPRKVIAEKVAEMLGQQPTDGFKLLCRPHINTWIERGLLKDVGAKQGPTAGVMRVKQDGADPAAKVERMRPAPTETVKPPKRGKSVPGTGKQFKGSGNAEIRELIQWATGKGATASPTSSGHIAISIPGGPRILISNTPRNPRTVLNDRSRLRKAFKEAGIAV